MQENLNSMKEKTYTYKLSIEKKHPIIITDEGMRLLVDTGSPITMSRPFRLCGKLMHGGPIFVDDIRRLSKLNINGILGLDVLEKYHVVIDYPNQQIVFSNKPLGIKGERLPINRWLGTIGFSAHINGHLRNALLDTGAPISYVNADLVEGYEIVGNDKDFYPGFGTFDVELRNVALRIGNAEEMEIKAGVLPGALAIAATVVGQAIIGYDLLSKAQVELDFEKGFIIIGV